MGDEHDWEFMSNAKRPTPEFWVWVGVVLMLIGGLVFVLGRFL